MRMNFFKPEEFDCPCCLKNECTEDLLSRMDSLRSLLAVPLFINSGYRCQKHNEKVGGKSSSLHLQGMAADVSTVKLSGPKKFELVKHAVLLFGGIGIAKTYIHLDIRQSKTLWIY